MQILVRVKYLLHDCVLQQENKFMEPVQMYEITHRKQSNLTQHNTTVYFKTLKLLYTLINSDTSTFDFC